MPQKCVCVQTFLGGSQHLEYPNEQHENTGSHGNFASTKSNRKTLIHFYSLRTAKEFDAKNHLPKNFQAWGNVDR